MNKEYNLKFEEAKNIKGFKITYSKSLNDIKRLFKECREKGYSDLLSSDNCLVCMELLNFSIDLVHYDIEEYGLDYAFACCAKYKDWDWNTEGFANLEIYEGIFDNKDKFEELMFYAMLDYIKENNLYWSKEN